MVNQPAQILLLDDEEDILQELSEFLTIRGIAHHIALNSATAMDILLNHKSVFILVTDILMRGTTGTEFIAELEKRGEMQTRNMYYIIISGHAGPEDIAHLIKVPHIFMAKPVDPHILAQELQKLLYQRSGGSQR